jgi:hypothetical protein
MRLADASWVNVLLPASMFLGVLLVLAAMVLRTAISARLAASALRLLSAVALMVGIAAGAVGVDRAAEVVEQVSPVDKANALAQGISSGLSTVALGFGACAALFLASLWMQVVARRRYQPSDATGVITYAPPG